MTEQKVKSYDRLQVYDRATNTWSARELLDVGFGETFKLDKTTDKGSNFKVRISGATAPTWNVMDWVRVLHLLSADEAIAYTADGLPDNFNEYVIGAIQKVYNKRYNYWLVSMELIEPIERFVGIVGETLSYTNQTHIEVYNPYTGTTATYDRDPYNHLTALERWLKVTPANCDSYASGYDPKNNISWFNRITISDADKAFLEAKPFADTTYNGLNLYEVLMDNFDASTGRTPVAYFDLDPETDLPRNPDRDEYILRFERQDGYDKEEIAMADLIHHASAITETADLNNYATGLVADVRNLASGQTVEYPAQRLYAVPEVDSDDIRDLTGKTEKGDEWIIKLPYPIKKIKKLIKLTMNGRKREYEENNNLLTRYYLTRNQTDITNRCYEKSMYLALIEEPNDVENLSWYKESERFIHLRDYVYDGGAEETYMYYIEYEPLPDARLIVGDTEYIQSVNQAGSQVDAPKFGAFMDNYLAGMNKPDLVISRTFEGYHNMKGLIGSRVIDGEKEYLITAMQYVNRQWWYDVMFQLNENHFRKSNNYEAAKEIKPNAIIPSDNLTLRQSALKQEIYISTAPTTRRSKYKFLTDKLVALSYLTDEEVGSEYYPQIALTLNSDGHYRLTDISQMSYKTTAIFIIKLEDNMTAGKKKTVVERLSSGSENNYYPFMPPQYQVPILYANYWGEVEKMSIYIGKVAYRDLTISQSFSEALPNSEEYEEYQATKEAYNIMAALPEISGNTALELIDNSVFKVINQQIHKDALENFSDTIIIDLVSDDILISDVVLKNSRLMSPSAEGAAKEILFLNRKIGLDDTIVSADIVATRSVGSTLWNGDEDDGQIQYSYITPVLADFKSIVVRTTAGEKLLIINKISLSVKMNAANSNVQVYYSN
jgi:hypothetical protein